MRNADMPAMPVCYQHLDDDGEIEVTTEMHGMTKREEIASRIMAGFAADPEMVATPAAVADLAIKWTDALLARLEKTS